MKKRTQENDKEEIKRLKFSFFLINTKMEAIMYTQGS